MILTTGRNMKAAFVKSVPLSKTVTGDIYAGMLFELNATGEAILATGTKLAWPTLSDRNPQRNSINAAEGVISLIDGAGYGFTTDMIDTTKVYAFGTKLKAMATGKLAPVNPDKSEDNLQIAVSNGLLIGTAPSQTLNVTFK